MAYLRNPSSHQVAIVAQTVASSGYGPSELQPGEAVPGLQPFILRDALTASSRRLSFRAEKHLRKM
jgi:hypothetical protein